MFAPADPITVKLDSILQRLWQHPAAAAAMRQPRGAPGDAVLDRLEKAISPDAAAILRRARAKGDPFSMRLALELAADELSEIVEMLLGDLEHEAQCTSRR